MELKLAKKIVLQVVQTSANRLAAINAREAVQVLALVNVADSAQIIVVEVVAIAARTIAMYGAIMVVRTVVMMAVQIAVRMVAKGVRNVLLVKEVALVHVLEVVAKLALKLVRMLVLGAAQDLRNTQLISRFNDYKRRKVIKMYQLIKSIFQNYTNNKIISTDDFCDDINETQTWLSEIEATTDQVIIYKDILIAFCCFGKFRYTKKEDLDKIINYLKKIVDIPTNQTTIIWLCQFELRRQLLSYLSEYNLMSDNNTTYLDIERELLKSIANDQSNFEQVKTIYGIKER